MTFAAFAVATGWAFVVVVALAQLRPAGATRVYDLRPSLHAARHLRTPHVPRPFAIAIPRRTLAVAGLLMVIAAVLFPPAALFVIVVVVARPIVRRRRDQRNQSAAVERDVVDTVALLGLAVSAGHNLTGAMRAASRRGDGPVVTAFRASLAGVDRGERLADMLEALPSALGDVVRPVVAALVSCDRYGAALGSTLDRLAADVRIASRHRAEAAARRLPVRLLFPLITCILPAFALLTVAPLIAGSFHGLGL